LTVFETLVSCLFGTIQNIDNKSYTHTQNTTTQQMMAHQRERLNDGWGKAKTRRRQTKHGGETTQKKKKKKKRRTRHDEIIGKIQDEVESTHTHKAHAYIHTQKHTRHLGLGWV
jgi:hypothetical protein